MYLEPSHPFTYFTLIMLPPAGCIDVEQESYPNCKWHVDGFIYLFIRFIVHWDSPDAGLHIQAYIPACALKPPLDAQSLTDGLSPPAAQPPCGHL